MVKVYYDSKNHSELVAIFDNEETFVLCLPALELEADRHGMTVTESVEDESLKDLEIKKF